jgi:malonyl-CoA O-methyltransferase
MPDPAAPSSAGRPVDARALAHITRRLAHLPEPPWLHREVARRMAERLQLIKQPPKTVIDWSAWLGGSADALQAALPGATRVLVEPESVLLARSQAQHKPGWWPLSRKRAAVFEPAQLPAAAGDLLWANMVLHGVADPPALLASWHRALAVDGYLMFSTLGPGTLEDLRTLYAEAGWGSPMAPLVDMHDLGDMLVQAGFADPVMDQETVTLTWADADALLAELRTLGGNADPARHAGLRTPRWHARLEQRLQARADAQGRIALRFELVYGHAFRVAAKPRVAAQTEVSLDAMHEMLRHGRRP